VDPSSLAPVERRRSPQRVDAGAPQDLIRELVSDPGDPTLVHHQRLDPRAASIEQLLELGAVDPRRVGPQRPGESPRLGLSRASHTPPSMRMLR
jgi:hypothetical protein